MLKFLEQLADLIQNWNDVEEEPDERARGNNLMCLILSETGSGLIGTIDHAPVKGEKIINFFYFQSRWNPAEPMILNGQKFSTLEELAEMLK